jgi:hypothetical protein
MEETFSGSQDPTRVVAQSDDDDDDDDSIKNITNYSKTPVT